MFTPSSRVLLLLAAIAIALKSCHGFQSLKQHRASTTRLGSTVIDAPTKEDLDRKVGRRGGNNDNGDLLGDSEENIEEAIRQQGPLEWLEDNPDESRDMEDPFHILILDTTFEKPKITVPYVASNLEYVLGMPLDDATDHSQWCFENGMSCVGVWPREECLALGRQLQLRDIVCRVVPYAEGGDRAWQVDKKALDANDMSRFLS